MTRDHIIEELKAGGSCLTDEEMTSLPLADLILARDAMSEPEEVEFNYSPKPVVSWQVERPSRPVTPKREQAIDGASMRGLARQQAKDDANNRAIERAMAQVKNGLPRQSFRARVTLEGCSYYLGTYRTKAEADEAVFKFKLGIVQ